MRVRHRDRRPPPTSSGCRRRRARARSACATPLVAVVVSHAIGVRRREVLGADLHAVDEEDDAGDGDVVGRVGRDRSPCPTASRRGAGAVIETVGGVVSGVFVTVTVTFAAVPRLPAASRARADSVCDPSATPRRVPRDRVRRRRDPRRRATRRRAGTARRPRRCCRTAVAGHGRGGARDGRAGGRRRHADGRRHRVGQRRAADGVFMSDWISSTLSARL